MCFWGGGRGGGEVGIQYTLIFSCIRRLGPFLGVQNFEFQYFFFFGGGGGVEGGSEK